MPTKRNAKGNPAFGPRLRTCRTCRGSFPSGSLVAGECSTCAGLLALPLRGEGGKFLSFKTDTEAQVPAQGSEVQR